MGMLSCYILVPESRIAPAIRLRAFIALGVIAYFGVGCYRTGAGAGGGLPILYAIILLQCAIMALKWRRERGMWMMYTLMGAIALGVYLLFELQPGGPAPSATNAHRALVDRDAAVGAWLSFINLRLMASVAVLNFRRFRGPNAGDVLHARLVGQHRPNRSMESRGPKKEGGPGRHGPGPSA